MRRPVACRGWAAAGASFTVRVFRAGTTCTARTPLRIDGGRASGLALPAPATALPAPAAHGPVPPPPPGFRAALQLAGVPRGRRALGHVSRQGRDGDCTLAPRPRYLPPGRQGGQGRTGAQTFAPRPAPPSKICAPPPKWASRVTPQPVRDPPGPALPDRRLRRSSGPGRPSPCALQVPRIFF
jgi:hypothetical protein